MCLYCKNFSHSHLIETQSIGVVNAGRKLTISEFEMIETEQVEKK